MEEENKASRITKPQIERKAHIGNSIYCMDFF